ncbi:TetR family transcriptional regulator C-terminal domain-containing protein, partial [Leucobacter sp. M11]|uniref:TetR family transcriptional regulator C-terminal domain-containing protein n=1 Tax=Leucobacter sp. M11 TaxID=2993565 RepID=UPI002D80F6D8
ERFLCAEFGDAANIREGSIVWNELRAAAVFDSERARQLAASTTDWQLRVVELIRAAEPALSREDAEARALSLTALVEGLSGRWLTGQLTAAEAQSAVRAALRD